MLRKFPSLAESEVEDLDFFLTVAIVCANIFAFPHASGDPRRRDEAIAAIRQALDDWHQRGNAALDDCTAFVGRNVEMLLSTPEYQADPSLVLPDAIGLWVVTNVLHRLPSGGAEFEGVRPIGRWCNFTLNGFWER
jgi:hypothetical protein